MPHPLTSPTIESYLFHLIHHPFKLYVPLFHHPFKLYVALFHHPLNCVMSAYFTIYSIVSSHLISSSIDSCHGPLFHPMKRVTQTHVFTPKEMCHIIFFHPSLNYLPLIRPVMTEVCVVYVFVPFHPP